MPYFTRVFLLTVMIVGLTARSIPAQEELPTTRLLDRFSQPSPLVRLTATSAGQTREKLRVELGKGFELATTQKHFVVAFPAGQRDFWSTRFEEIYNSFYLYFSVRGIKMREPSEPLVVIVFPNQRDFQRYATAEGSPISAGVLGYYLPRSNRVAMYDLGSGGKSDEAWAANSEILIHELAHQIAFNTGVHDRYSQPPRWLAEGLGTLFEARGVWKSRSYPAQKDRLNQGRLRDYRHFATTDDTGIVAGMIESDRLFQTNPQQAYAYAWAMSFYLTETQPRKYSDYLQATAKRSAGSSKAERMKDFMSIFGQDLKIFETRFTRYMKDVKG